MPKILIKKKKKRFFNSKSSWPMKDHVTLKTGENMLKIQHCHYRN